jgi:hypothetical protein
MRSRLPWILWLLFVAVSLTAGVLKTIYGPAIDDSNGVFVRIGWLFAFGVFATVGAIVVSRRAGHAIGWIYLLGALAGAMSTLASALIDTARSNQRVRPGQVHREGWDADHVEDDGWRSHDRLRRAEVLPPFQFLGDGTVRLNPRLAPAAGGAPQPPKEATTHETRGVQKIDGGTYSGSGFWSSGLIGADLYIEYTLGSPNPAPTALPA